MGATYRVGRLSDECVDKAYSLVNLVAPALDLEAWRTLCRNMQSHWPYQPEIGDMIVAVNPLGYVQGLCISSARDHAVEGRLLDVPFVVIASAADAAGVAGDLMDWLEAHAASEGCEKLRIWTSEKDGWTRHFTGRDVRLWEHGILLSLRAHVPVPQPDRPQGFPVKT